MDDAEQGQHRRHPQAADRRAIAVINERGEKGAPDHRSDDKAIAQHNDEPEFRQSACGRDQQLREVIRCDIGRIAELDCEQPRDGRKETEHHGTGMRDRSRRKRLGGDLQRDEYQHWRQHRERQQLDQISQIAEHTADADEHAGQQGIAGTRAHFLVGRMTDVGRGLRDPAAESGDDSRDCFDQQDVARVVVVAGRARAFGVVDAAHDEQQTERQ